MESSFASFVPKGADSLQSLEERYQIFLIDIVGIVHDGVAPYPGAVEALNRLIAQKKTVIFLSNNPRPHQLITEGLLRLGLKPGFHVFTSGDLTRLLLMTMFEGQPLFHLGASRNLELTQDLKLHLVEEVEQASLVLLTAFLEETEDIRELDPIIDAVVAHNINVLCANPDLVAMHGATTRRCAGTIAARIQERGGEVMFAGKPHRIIYEQLPLAFPDLKFGDKSEMVMIGDTLETDILGGAGFGIDTMLVLTGNTGNMLRATRQELPDYLEQHAHMARPTWVAETLKGESSF